MKFCVLLILLAPIPTLLLRAQENPPYIGDGKLNCAPEYLWKSYSSGFKLKERQSDEVR